MASPSSTNTMLTIPEKKTTATNLYNPLRTFIVNTYSQHEAQTHEDDLQTLNSLRTQIQQQTNDRDVIISYYKALTAVESRFPIGKEENHARVSFTWYDAFKTRSKVSEESVQFEKSAVLFYLGAPHTSFTSQNTHTMTIQPSSPPQQQETKKHKHSSRRHKNKHTHVTINEKTPLVPKKQRAHSEFNGASMSGAIMNLSTTIIGAGIMALPATMKVLGLGLGIIVIVLVGVLSEATVRILLKYSRGGGSDSYAGLMDDAFGDVGKKVLESCVVINNLGVLVIYMIILGDVVAGSSANGVHHPGLLEGWFGPHWWTGRVFVLLVTTIGVFVPLASLKRMDSLSVTSSLAVALAVVFLLILAGISIFKIINGSLPMPRLLPDITDINSVWNLFTAVPVLVTAYICHFNVHSIGNELENPALIEPIVQISLVLCTLVYIMTSFFGFILFGDSTMGDILSNFDSDLGVPFSIELNDIVRVSYALHLMLVFPLVFYALRLNADGLFFGSSQIPLESDNKRFAIISAGLLLVIYLGANFIPSAWDAFQFTGATAAVCIGFIFPASIAIKDVHGIATRRDKMLAVLMIGLAVFANVIAIYSDAYALFKKKPSPTA